MNPLDGQFFQNLLNQGYTNDFRNLAVVAAHGIDDQTLNQMISAYFRLPVNPAPQPFRMNDLDPMSLDGDNVCYEFTYPQSNNNSDIRVDVVRWADPQRGTRISVDVVRGLLRWWNVDTLLVSKSVSDGENSVVYSAIQAGKVIIFMDITRDRP